MRRGVLALKLLPFGDASCADFYAQESEMAVRAMCIFKKYKNPMKNTSKTTFVDSWQEMMKSVNTLA